MKKILLFLGVFCLLISFMTACGNDEPQTQEGIDITTEAAKEEPKGAIDAGIEETTGTVEAAKKEAGEAVEAGIQKSKDGIESAEEKAEGSSGEAQKEVEGVLNQ